MSAQAIPGQGGPGDFQPGGAPLALPETFGGAVWLAGLAVWAIQGPGRTGVGADVMERLVKDPESIRRVAVPFAQVLGGDVIESAAGSAIVSGTGGLTIEQALFDSAKGAVQLTFSGGTVGDLYVVKAVATTNNGQTLVYRFEVKIEEQA